MCTSVKWKSTVLMRHGAVAMCKRTILRVPWAIQSFQGGQVAQKPGAGASALVPKPSGTDVWWLLVVGGARGFWSLPAIEQGLEMPFGAGTSIATPLNCSFHCAPSFRWWQSVPSELWCHNAPVHIWGSVWWCVRGGGVLRKQTPSEILLTKCHPPPLGRGPWGHFCTAWAQRPTVS